MSLQLEFNYARVNKSTRKCVAVFTSEEECYDNALYEYIRLDSLIEEYYGKYYIDGAWYEDAAGTIPWSPEA